jgi:hypothetical protein
MSNKGITGHRNLLVNNNSLGVFWSPGFLQYLFWLPPPTAIEEIPKLDSLIETPNSLIELKNSLIETPNSPIELENSPIKTQKITH